jgi:hypothetical protein
MNLTGCSSMPTGSLHGVWYRAVLPRYLPSCLSAAHTPRFPSRFNIGSAARPPAPDEPSPTGAVPTTTAYETLYLADDPTVALLEFGALLGALWTAGGTVAHPRAVFAQVTVNVSLQAVADLTQPRAALVPGPAYTLLDTTAQELTGDWNGYRLRAASSPAPRPTGIAPTQELGLALHSVPDLEGFISFSARAPDHRVLVVFTDKLRRGSSMTAHDGSGSRVARVTGHR